MFDLSGLQLRYEPYPIGLAKNIFPPDLYAELAASYPPVSEFRYMPNLGRKYSLAEANNGRNYHRFLASTPVWKKFHDWVKSRDFLATIFRALSDKGVPLGLEHHASGSLITRQIGKYYENRSLTSQLSYLNSRFEFSMMPGDGGYINPHTDAPHKLITLVVSMCREGEWDQAAGGGTAIVHPKDPKNYFNWNNRNLAFDDVDISTTWEFLPNQCIIFVKTFNSWHAVEPMRGGADALRKTLTINIERKWL